ncbi:DUF3035 domain-containing protein [Rhodosalinus sp. 5P4]|uniref:DUF3035 domain-containing protein n=1 Tax=Rhodosalinus sp. 5P4 TaxID=3239196 RepID=UPI0035258F70
MIEEGAMRWARLVLVALVAVTLAGCGARGERDLRQFPYSLQQGPEEFAVVPFKPLETPQSFAELPTPTPGARNRVDLTPNADAVAALGGDPAALSERGVPASDGALVSHASRYGVPAGLRARLAAEDAEYRQRFGLFTFQLIRNDRYRQAYRRQALDPNAALEAYRRAGLRTPSAPPQ